MFVSKNNKNLERKTEFDGEMYCRNCIWWKECNPCDISGRTFRELATSI